jgi:hypothetical protein
LLGAQYVFFAFPLSVEKEMWAAGTTYTLELQDVNNHKYFEIIRMRGEQADHFLGTPSTVKPN